MGNTQATPAFLQVPSAKDFSSVTVQPGKQALIMAQNEPFLKLPQTAGWGSPPAMQAVWDYEHENIIEWIARINVLIGMYSKP